MYIDADYQALLQGEFQGTSLDIKDGYIHCSPPDEVTPTLEKYFTDFTVKIWLCQIDSDTYNANDLKWEWVESRNASFPHIFNVPILPEHIIKAHALESKDGKWIIPDLNTKWA